MVRAERPVMEVRRLDCMDRILREERCERLAIELILFFPSHSSSREVRLSRFSIS